MAIVYHLAVIICMAISSLDDENKTKILKKHVEDLTCTKTVPRCSPNFHQIIRSVARFTASLTKIDPIIENLLFNKAKEGLTSFWARVDPISDKCNHIYVHETSQHKEKSYSWDTKILIKCILGQKVSLCSLKPQMVNETLETLTSFEINAEIIGFEEEQRTFKSSEKSSIDVGLIARLLCLLICLRQCEITVNLKMKQGKMERISLRVTPNFKHSLQDVLTSFNESDFVNTEHKKISRCLTFPTAIQTHNNSKLVVYPASAVSLLASYRPLMYMELPNSIFFVQLSAHGFRYPGTGSSVLCVGCDNSVDLSLFTSDPSCAIYHKPGCQFVKVGTIETASTHSSLGGPQSESTQSSEASRGCIKSQEAISQKLLRRENEALKQQMKCKSCQTADVQDLFLPCGHMSTCKQCSNKFSQCPACGKRILGTVNVYFA
ncbi:baculoviral IAP repeat-containing protein 2-like isoform X1 [Biomphalaria pfeifferi]|uniref:Baculoviral IAP repeat-containing protein 2-like isoform X1 n=1 Tax=Biomphalaria pfeifferi TaxID=112525 RepID=A0AAD8FI76_BIOPF|nr:baculoviral IAP repeat-containing protein 2-like isoform X1 [Biomphalaria pfeifferi]